MEKERDRRVRESHQGHRQRVLVRGMHPTMLAGLLTRRLAGAAGRFLDTGVRAESRRVSLRRNSETGPGLPAFVALALLAGGTAVPARAEGPLAPGIPKPFYPSVEERSGMLSRFVPIQPWLPHDKLRDTFYDTRWDDCPDT